MKKMMILCFSIILIFTGGCSMNDSQNGKNGNQEEAVKPKDMNPKDLPQVPAFQDEKTREYMASTKEVEPGYYLLESKLKGFTMMFPEDGKYLSRRSSLKGKNKESIGFGSYDQATNILFDGHLTYHSGASYANERETMLDIVRGKNGYKGEFEEKTSDDKVIYFAHMKDVDDDVDRKYNFTYSYFGYAKSIEADSTSLEYTFTFSCKKDDQPCSLDESKTRKKVEKMINSITFLKKEKLDG
ncbi:lipoprotein YvcA [Bacillus paralicheniformis]|uniref:lipoprotein YvcA n=1 Tax=Bacillus paralicheniformis TaxID=1648923 RepID=UPI0035F59255